MPLGDPFLPQPPPELILEEWKDMRQSKETRPEKQPICIHKTTCYYVYQNTFCFYERKGIRCVYYSPQPDKEAGPAPSDLVAGRKALIEHNRRIKSIAIKKVLDELDRRCAIGAREYMPDPDAGEYASDEHRDPFNEVREWIRSLRE